MIVLYTVNVNRKTVEPLERDLISHIGLRKGGPNFRLSMCATGSTLRSL